MDPRPDAPHATVPETGITWKRFVLELPVATTPTDVKGELVPLRDEPLGYYALKALNFVAEHFTPEMQREFGRAMVRDATRATVADHIQGWALIGLGHLDFSETSPGSYTVTSTDLPLHVSAGRAPSCRVVLGLVEGLARAHAGRDVLGTEIHCRSAGHADCAFMVRAR